MLAAGSPGDPHLPSLGHPYYPFVTPVGVRMRLMCSFATTAADIDTFLADLPQGARAT